MLQANDIDIADVEKIGGAQVAGKILLVNLKSHDLRILISCFGVVHRNAETLTLWIRICDRSEDIRRKRGDATLTRKMIADKGDLAHLGCFFHEPLGCETDGFWKTKKFRRQAVSEDPGGMVGQ